MEKAAGYGALEGLEDVLFGDVDQRAEEIWAEHRNDEAVHVRRAQLLHDRPDHRHRICPHFSDNNIDDDYHSRGGWWSNSVCTITPAHRRRSDERARIAGRRYCAGDSATDEG